MTAIKTFTFPSDIYREETQQSEFNNQENLVNIEPKTPDIESLLFAMPKEKRDLMLARLFKKDLASIIDLEVKKGFDSGYNEGVKKAKVVSDEKIIKQQGLFEEKLSNLAVLIESFTNEKKQIVLDKPEHLIEVINIALFRLLGEKVENGSYLKSLLLQITQEFSYDESLTLNLSGYDHNLVKSYFKKENNSLINSLKIKEDKNIMPGSFRVSISSGDITSDLNEKLRCLLSNFENRQRVLAV